MNHGGVKSKESRKQSVSDGDDFEAVEDEILNRKQERVKFSEDVHKVQSNRFAVNSSTRPQ